MRIKCVLVGMVTAILAGSSQARAQSAILSLPDLSQHARVMQRIGLTDITIDYHRPLVRGRKIFGGALAYGNVWRAGANYNTTIEFSDPVTVDGRPLPRGVYGLHMIPGESSWIVIFSRDATSWGSFTYDQSEDALRITVAPQKIAAQEALTYDFGVPGPDSVEVTMRYEDVAVPFTVAVETDAIVDRSLRSQLRGRAQAEWAPWEEAANYLLSHRLSAEQALQYAERSIGIEDRFENEITRARALEALGRREEADASSSKAFKLGSQSQIYWFARNLQALGQQDLALDLFRHNIDNAPNTWIAHMEGARVAVAAGDFDTAMKETNRAIAVAPETTKGPLRDVLRQLACKVDINK